MARIVDTVLVQDEGFGKRADLEQTVPVGGIPRQARDLQPHHHTDPPKADFGHHTLKATALSRRRAREPEILVDNDQLFGGPAERLSSPLEIILPRGALAMLVHLME